MIEETPQGRFIFDGGGETVAVDPETARRLRISVVPVLFRYEETRVEMVGTAFCIYASPTTGEAVFVTASHVVDPLDPDRVEGVSQPEIDIEAFVVLPTPVDPEDFHGVRIHTVIRSLTFSDVAILLLNLNDCQTADLNVKVLRISFAEPIVGRHTMALGYPQLQGEVRYHLVASRGQIEEVHPSRRDRSLSTFPSFRVTGGSYLHGMSGGPIFDNGSPEGRPDRPSEASVIGVVSSGFETPNGDVAIGYGASIAGILEMELDVRGEDGSLHHLSMNDFLATGAVLRTAHEVTFHRCGDGVTLVWGKDKPPPGAVGGRP